LIVSRVLVIPDLQVPFHHPYSLTFLKRVRDEFKTDKVICVGDEADAAALSKYPKDPDGMSAGAELRKARRALKPFYKEFPDVQVCNSNHQQRLYKRAFEAGIPRELIVGYREYLAAPAGWCWQDGWSCDGVLYEHGDRASGYGAGLKLIDANHRSTVYGHHHSTAGLGYVRKGSLTLFWMNVGCLIDEDSYAMSYTKMHRTKPILSCGVVIDGVPQLVPMHKGLRVR
jgi:hypothetical protein